MRQGAAETESRTARVLVGRDRELGELRSGFAEAIAGRPTVFMLAGEPGIGKTHLAEALAAHAAEQGALTLWGACWEAGGAPAYWPWTQALRSIVRQREPGQLREELGDGAPFLARIVPQIRDKLPDVEPGSPDDDPEQWRFRLFDAMTQFLVRASAADPLVLVLDDLHWADHSTLLALEFVARNATDARLLVVGTYRDAEVRRREDVAARLGGVVRDDRRMPLAGLDAPALVSLVEARTSIRPADDLVQAMLDVTEGNPFFATELARLLDAEGLLRAPAGRRAGPLPLPAGVRDAIRRRLEPLAPDVVEVLSTASVIGRQFRVSTLAGAAGRPQGEVLELLDAALEVGAIDAIADRPGRYAFSHVLVRETLYDALRPSRRVELHRSVGEALERASRAGDAEHLTEVAFHFLQAAPGGETDKAVMYATQAADQAMGVHAYVQAAALYEQTLATLEVAQPDDARRAPLLHAHGEALLRAGDHVQARAVLERAAEVARRAGDERRLARCVLACGMWGLGDGILDERLITLLEQAIALLDGATDAEGRGLLAQSKGQLASTLYWVGPPERRRELCDEAIAIARALPELGADANLAGATLAFVLDRTLLATWGPESATDDVALCEELIELAQQVGFSEVEMQARFWRMTILLELDDFVGFDQEVARLERMAAELRQPRAKAYVPLAHGIRAVLEGRFEDAEQLAAEGARLAEGVAGTTAAMVARSQYFAMRWAQGRLGEIEVAVRAAADQLSGQPAWRAALSLLLCETGRMAEARAELDRLAPDDFAALRRDHVWIVGLALCVETAAAIGDAERARVLHGLLEPYAARNAVSPSSACVGPVSRFLGIAAATSGDWDEAARRFAEATAMAERHGARPLAAHLRLDEARALSAADAPSDPQRLARLVAEGRAIAEELGMDAIVARFDALGAPPPSAAATGPSEARLQVEGDVWTFSFEGHPVRVTDGKGVRYLALLLESPGVEIHAIDLVGADEGAAPGATTTAAAAAEAGLAIAADDAGAVLDAEAKRAYKSRLAELREDLEEAESFNDPERASRAREEIEFLTHELAGAVGLGGRDRKTGSNAERARVNVTRAIRTLLKRLTEHDAALGHELEATIRTGTYCAFEPDPRRPVSWTVERASHHG
jgi:tetratricopeptide (TPR) repeat protein